MLESEKKSEQNWHGVVQAEKGSCSPRFLEEREVGLEQEGIIVVTD